jgi:hypothetical protein
MTGRRGSICTEVIASRAEARMKAFLKLGWAMHSWLHTKRVPSCTPDRAHFQIAGDQAAMADAAGDEDREVGGERRQYLLREHRVLTGPIWPPASIPSITSASTPGADQLLGQAQRRREADQLGARSP